MGEEILSDYRATGLSLFAHPLSLLREQLRARRVLGSNDLHGQRHGSNVHAAGIVTQRQRPQTASGTIFVTLEDAHGTVNVIVWPRVAQRRRTVLLNSTLLAVRGRREQVDGGYHPVASHPADLRTIRGGMRAESDRKTAV